MNSEQYVCIFKLLFQVYSVTTRANLLSLSCAHEPYHELFDNVDKAKIIASLSFNADPSYVSRGYSTFGE